MEQLISCKFCKETEFKFHEEINIFNPETSEEESILNVHECISCGAYYFEIDNMDCWQLAKNPVNSEHTAKLDNYMKS